MRFVSPLSPEINPCIDKLHTKDAQFKVTAGRTYLRSNSKHTHFHFTIFSNIVLQKKYTSRLTNINHHFLPQNVLALPSTFVIKLQDRFRVRSEDREANPSIRQMWLDDRSRCRICHAVVKPSIFVRRLQWRFRDEVLGFSWTSSRLKINTFREVTNTHYCTYYVNLELNSPWNILINQTQLSNSHNEARHSENKLLSLSTCQIYKKYPTTRRPSGGHVTK